MTEQNRASFTAYAKTQSLQAQDFFSRAERITKMKIPASCMDSVIVQPNNEGIGFRFNCYSSDFLPKSITKDRFDQTVRASTKVCESTYLEKKNEEQSEFSRPYKKILVFGSLMILVAMILLMIRVYGEYDSKGLWIAALVLIVVTMVVTILIVVRIYLVNPKFINVDEATKERLTAFLESENAKFYRNLGYEWRMEPSYYWLELVKLNDTMIDNANLKTGRFTTENDPLNED